MAHSIPYWLHLMAAAAWLGPQIVMFLAIVPGLAHLDQSSRYRLMRTVTMRLGVIGGLALGVLVVTGLDNIDRYAPSNMFDFRYGYILALKLTMVGVAIALTVAHSAFVGPLLLRQQELALSGGGSERTLGRFRRLSIVLTSLTLLLTLAIFACAALLRGPWAYGAV